MRGRIFATLPDPEHIRVMVDEPAILSAVDEDPASCAPYYWGRRLACVEVTLRKVATPQLRELLIEAWLRKAPKSLARAFLDT